MKLLILVGFSFWLVGSVSAQEIDQEYEAPCAHSTLRGTWVGPEDRMTMDDECKGSSEVYDSEFTFDDSEINRNKVVLNMDKLQNEERFSKGKNKCQFFQKNNELIVDCGKGEELRYHRYNPVVHK